MGLGLRTDVLSAVDTSWVTRMGPSQKAPWDMGPCFFCVGHWRPMQDCQSKRLFQIHALAVTKAKQTCPLIHDKISVTIIINKAIRRQDDLLLLLACYYDLDQMQIKY